MIWHHLICILHLRWALTRNQILKYGGLGTAIAGILAFLAVALSVVSLVSGLALGAVILKQSSPQAIMAICNALTIGFVFTWISWTVLQIQRSESLDFQQFLYLPVPLRQVFVFNFIASHLNWVMVIAISGIIGLTIGLVASRGWMMALLLPLALGLVFMISAWTYCLCGRIAALGTSPRKRNSVIALLTISVVSLIPMAGWFIEKSSLSGEVPYHMAAMAELQKLPEFWAFIPPLWLPTGARALTQNNPWLAILEIFGFFTIGAIGLMIAYQDTLKFQRGETRSLSRVDVPSGNRQKLAAASSRELAGFLEMRIPWLPEPCAAVALAEFRVLLRAPEMKLKAFMLVLIPTLFAISQMTAGTPKIGESGRMLLLPSVWILMALLIMPILANQFGFSRDAIRCMVLSPVERSWYLLGRNLAFLPFFMASAMVLLTICSIFFRLSLGSIMASLFQLISITCILGIIGNFLSIRFPYRVSRVAVKPTKMPASVMLAMILIMPIMMLAFMPIMLPAMVQVLYKTGASSFPVDLSLSALIAAVMIPVDWLTLKPFGRMLERHEIKILAAVTTGVE